MRSFILVVGLLFSTTLTWAQAYQVPIHVLPTAGGVSASTSFSVSGSLGQPIVGISTNTAFLIASGFWPQVPPVIVSNTENSEVLQPNVFWLGQNYPNPFNPTTIIPLSLDRSGPVDLVIFNLLGQEVRKFDLSSYRPGTHSVVWDGRDKNGIAVSSGMLFYQLRAHRTSVVQRMIYLR